MTRDDSTPLRLLVVDGDDALKETVVRALRRRGEPVSAVRVEEATALEATLDGEGTDLVLHRPGLPELATDHVVAATKRHTPAPPVILVDDGTTPPGDVGARDRIDPGAPEDLVHRLRREAGDLEIRRQLAETERRYRDSERRAHELVDRSRDPIAYVQEGILVHANPAFRRRLGEEAEPEGSPLLEWLAGDHRNTVKQALRRTQGGQGRPAPLSVELLRAGGHQETVHLDLRPADYEGEPAVQLTLQSSEENSALRRRVRRLEHQDPITGLFNRQHFLQALEALRPEGDAGTTVIVLAVDHFEQLRERLNPAGADALLARIADRLRRRFSPRHHLARFQSSRFTALLNALEEAELERLGQALTHDIADEIFEVGDHSLSVSASVGIACWDGSESPVELLERAVDASREAGGGATRVAPAPGGATTDDPETADDWRKTLEGAMAEGRLLHLFQPIGDVRSAGNHGGELLMRLRDTEGRLHPPGQFFAAARRAGLLPRLDRISLEHAASRLAMGAEGPSFIKITAESLEDTSFAERLMECCPGGWSGRLVLEMAEAEVVNHLRAAVAFSEASRAAGAAIALEHFGSAPDGEAAQERLRADYLKIDGALISQLADDADARARLEGIVRLARETGATTIAECVESAHILPLLWQAGIDRIQGYFLRPPAEE